MPGTRRKGNPEREIHTLFNTLNQEQDREKHDVASLYEGRLRSHAQNFEVSFYCVYLSKDCGDCGECYFA
jgi:hypothetical protein